MIDRGFPACVIKIKSYRRENYVKKDHLNLKLLKICDVLIKCSQSFSDFSISLKTIFVEIYSS